MIIANNIKKKYERFDLDISLEIPKGRITGLVGKNGAGKSTTIKAILGLIRLDSGSVQVMGTEVKDMTSKQKQNIGVALSDSGFSNYLTVKDAVKIMSRMYDTFEKDAFLEGCEKYGLPINQQVQKFSTGMKAKLKVLMALSHGAKLLILDEPTSGMDVEARQEILDMLREYLAEDEERTILITSHIATDLEGICDDIYLIHGGRILFHEDTDLILSDYAMLKVSEEDFKTLDKEYVLKYKEEAFGYACLTNQKQFYLENYPGMVIEKCGIDDIILMMTGGR